MTAILFCSSGRSRSTSLSRNAVRWSKGRRYKRMAETGYPVACDMPNIDYSIYFVQGAFWASFGLTRLILRAREPNADRPREKAAAATPEVTAKFSRAVFAVHFVAFGVMYIGLGNAVVPGRVPAWFPGQRVVGTLVIAAGAALMSWALVYFESWRFRAKLDADHQLATGGPFRYLRHPIYMGMNLLALGTAVWVPTPIVWASMVLM